jgi:hypothetical protein
VVRCYTHEPVLERQPWVVPFEILKELTKDLLRQILGVASVANHSIHNIEDAPSMTIDEHGE